MSRPRPRPRPRAARQRGGMRNLARQQALLELLLSQRLRPVQVEAIAQRLGVSERTVERDLERLRGSRLPLRGRGGSGGGVWLDVTRTRPPLQLADEQVMVLLLALDALPEDLPPGLSEIRDLLRGQLSDPRLF